MYTEQEIAFLMQPQRTANAERSSHPLAASVDIRTLGCPTHIFNRLLEDRARKLGPKFTEFRNRQCATRIEAATPADLDTRVAASSLF